ncbi:hypothetical protein [Burkholderia ambifaria]
MRNTDLPQLLGIVKSVSAKLRERLHMFTRVRVSDSCARAAQ